MVGGDADVFAHRRAGARALRARRHADGRPGHGPAHQDGQPDLHRRAGAGARPRASTSRRGPGSTSSACSTSSARAPRNRGRWTIAARRWSPTSSTSASPSTGCARISRICLGRSARATAPRCRSTALVDQFYARIQARGGGRWDTSSLIRVLRDAAMSAACDPARRDPALRARASSGRATLNARPIASGRPPRPRRRRSTRSRS